jgi:hypothetical protein
MQTLLALEKNAELIYSSNGKEYVERCFVSDPGMVCEK